MKIATARTLNDGQGSSRDLDRFSALYIKFDGEFYRVKRGADKTVQLQSLKSKSTKTIEGYGASGTESDFKKGYSPIGKGLKKFGLESDKRKVFDKLLSVNQESKSEGELVLQRAAGSLTAIPDSIFNNYLIFKGVEKVEPLKKYQAIYVVDLDEECIKPVLGFSNSLESKKDVKNVDFEVSPGTTSDKFIDEVMNELDVTYLVTSVDLSAEPPTQNDINILMRNQLFVGLSAIKNFEKSNPKWNLLNDLHKDMTLNELLSYAIELDVDLDTIVGTIASDLESIYYECKLEGLLQDLEAGKYNDQAAFDPLRAQLSKGAGDYNRFVKAILKEEQEDWIEPFMANHGGYQAKYTVKSIVSSIKYRVEVARLIAELETETIQGNFISNLYLSKNGQFHKVTPYILGGDVYQRLAAIFSYFILGCAAIAISVLALAVFANPITAMVSIPLAVIFTTLCALSVTSHLAFSSSGKDLYQEIAATNQGIKNREFIDNPAPASTAQVASAAQVATAAQVVEVSPGQDHETPQPGGYVKN